MLAVVQCGRRSGIQTTWASSAMEDRQQAGRHSCLLLAVAPYIWLAIGQGQIFKGSDWSDNSELWIPIGSAQIEVGGSRATTSFRFLKIYQIIYSVPCTEINNVTLSIALGTSWGLVSLASQNYSFISPVGKLNILQSLIDNNIA